MEIIPNVHRISGVEGANIYLLLEPTLVLIDTGMPGNAEIILNYIRSLGRAPTDLARIIITHYHVDHIGSLAELAQQTQAQILAHPEDVPYISGEREQPAPRWFILRLLFKLMPNLSRYTPAQVNTPIQDGEMLEVLSGAQVIHVPGHTPGSIALHFAGERLLISGDTINHRRNRLSGPPTPFTADMPLAIKSIHRMAELDFDVLCPGHGDPIIGGADQQVREMAQKLA